MNFLPMRTASALAVALALTACGGTDPMHEQPAEKPVISVFNAALQELDVTQELPGRVHAFRVAQVRARVAGIVTKRMFTEGMDVKAGQVLYQIDSAPFEAAVERASADVQRMVAAEAEAKATFDRYTPLAKIEAVSQQDLVAAQTALKTASANLVAARADLKASRLNLEYATVRAPISGRIGRSLVTEGALVGQGEATALATIQQIDRVYVDVTQPVADAMRLREAADSGAMKSEGRRILARVEGTQKTSEGKFLFSDISVDPTSGQVTLRGEFPNPNALMLPGMFVRVAIQQGVAAEAILLPQRAVRIDSDGVSHVMVVDKDDALEDRTVRVGQMYGANWHIIEGIKAGERVMVGGPDVAPGQQVTVASVPGNSK